MTAAELERALHAIFRLKGRQVNGAGAEWFIATPEEVVAGLQQNNLLAPPDAPGVTSMAGRTRPAMAGGTGVRSAPCFAAAVAA